MDKYKSNLRIGFSALAMVLFALFAVWNNFIIPEAEDYSSYSWRMGVLCDIARFIPFVALFVFSVCERKLKNVNPRMYLIILFTMLVLQYVIAGRWNCLSLFSHASMYWHEIFSGIRIFFAFVFMVRFVALMCLPVFGKSVIKVVSGSMITVYSVLLLFAVFMGDILIYDSDAKNVELVIDIIFYVALYFFNDLCTEDNKLDIYDKAVDFIFYRIFKLDDEEYIEELDEECFTPVSKRKFILQLYYEYQKVLAYALCNKKEEVLRAAVILERLSHKNIIDENGELYTKDFIHSQLDILNNYIGELNREHPEYIDSALAGMICIALDKKEESDFYAEAINVATILNKTVDAEWLEAVVECNKARKQ